MTYLHSFHTFITFTKVSKCLCHLYLLVMYVKRYIQLYIMINYLIVTLLLYFEMSTILGDDVMVDGVYIVTSVASVTVIPIMSVICFYFYDIIVISFFFMFKCNFELYNVRNYYCTWKKINYYYIIKIEAYHWVCTWKHTSYQLKHLRESTEI